VWSFWPGAVSFVVALTSAFVIDIAAKLPKPVRKAVLGVGLVISVYSVANGLYHMFATWQNIDLLSAAADKQMNLSVKRVLALVLIQIWPLVAIFMGGLGGLLYYTAAINKRD
jgi:hypothetical protein